MRTIQKQLIRSGSIDRVDFYVCRPMGTNLFFMKEMQKMAKVDRRSLQ